MFLLDTNVVSEMRRQQKMHPRVFAWATRTPFASMYLSTITVFELELGVLRIERKDAKQAAPLRWWLEQRVLSVCQEAALSSLLTEFHLAYLKKLGWKVEPTEPGQSPWKATAPCERAPRSGRPRARRGHRVQSR